MGTASYWSTPTLDDLAWSYEKPLGGSARISGYLCFLHDDLSIQVDRT